MEYQTYVRRQQMARLEAEANRILKSGKVCSQDAGPHMKEVERDFMVTDKWIRSNATPAGGYKNEQLRLIGLRYPLSSGWMKEANGRVISNSDRIKFESFHTGYKATKKSKSVMEGGKKIVQNDIIFGKTEPTHRHLDDCECNVQPWEDCEHTLTSV